MNMSITHFKATCLGVIEKVQKEKCSVVITRHGRPAAELVPIHAGPAGQLFGRSESSTEILGDIMSTGESWDAED